MNEDTILEKLNLTGKRLSKEEAETLDRWLGDLDRKQLTIEKIREYIGKMKESVEREISEEPTFIRILLFKVENPKIIRLQARLHNYILLESFLTAPERARKALERTIEDTVKRAGGK